MSKLSPILAAVRSHVHTISDHPADQSTQSPFITISREAGAGGRTLMRQLIESLKRLDPPQPGQQPWAGFDRELVEKVANDHHLHRSLVELLGEQCHSWLYDVFTGMSTQTTESQVYRRVAETIRGLALGGRAVIVGRGGALVTQNIPLGIHIQIVAPFDHRAEQMAHVMKTDLKHAATEVRRIDQNRASFYKRFWPNTPLSPSIFTLTLNSAAIGEENMLAAILPLVPGLSTGHSRVVTRKVTVK